MSTCHTCSASIKFVRMRDTGRPLPIDCHPDQRGNIAATPTAAGKQYVDGRYCRLDQELAEGEVRLMPHFATCNDPRKPGHPRPRQPEPQPPLDF